MYECTHAHMHTHTRARTHTHHTVTDLPRIGDDPNRNYTLYNKDDDTVCLYASFDMHFMVVYNIGSDSKVPCPRDLFRGRGAQGFPTPEVDFSSLEFVKCTGTGLISPS